MKGFRSWSECLSGLTPFHAHCALWPGGRGTGIFQISEGTRHLAGIAAFISPIIFHLFLGPLGQST